MEWCKAAINRTMFSCQGPHPLLTRGVRRVARSSQKCVEIGSIESYTAPRPCLVIGDCAGAAQTVQRGGGDAEVLGCVGAR